MKEDVGIGRDFAQRMSRRFHNEQTSRRCARFRVKLRRGRPNECRSDAVGAVALARVVPSCPAFSVLELLDNRPYLLADRTLDRHPLHWLMVC